LIRCRHGGGKRDAAAKAAPILAQHLQASYDELFRFSCFTAAPDDAPRPRHCHRTATAVTSGNAGCATETTSGNAGGATAAARLV